MAKPVDRASGVPRVLPGDGESVETLDPYQQDAWDRWDSMIAEWRRNKAPDERWWAREGPKILRGLGYGRYKWKAKRVRPSR